MSTVVFIGGTGGAPRKVSSQVAFKWLFCTQYGYFMGTNDVYMGTNVHICIQIVPPKSHGGIYGGYAPEIDICSPLWAPK